MENIKKRRIIEIIVFLAIVVSSLIVFYPAAKALEKQLVYVRDKLIKTVEDEFEIKITYESISPSFFDRIKIRDVTIYNAATNEKIAHFSLLYIDYRLISLIKKDFTSVIASLGVYDGIINFNIEKNKNILKKLNAEDNAVDKTVKDRKKDESTESSLDISTIIDAGSQKIKNTKPIKLELKNIALNYSDKNSNIDFYTSSGKLTLESGKIDVYINSSLRYSNFMQTNFPDLSTLININGSFYPGTISASLILNFSDIKIGNIYINKFSLFASYLDKIASITTMQDIQPIDVKGSWNLAENAGSINIECNDLKPLSVVSSSEGTDILKELKDAAFTGQVNLTFAGPEKLLWDTAFSIKLPKFQIAGNKIEKSILSFKADGTDDLINLKNLKLTNSDINLSAQGSYKIKEILPNFYLNVSKFKLPSGENMAMNLNVSSNKNKIFLKIPRVDIGKASLENIQGLFEKKTGKTDIYLSGKDPGGGFSIDGTWTHPSKSGSSGKNKGYLELHGTIDSISIENIYNGAVSFTDLTVPVQKLLEASIAPVQMTSEFYISSDFEHFSYNIIQAVLASKSKNGFYSLFSLQGNESSLNISDIDVLFNNMNLRGNINSAFEKDSMIFDSLLTLNDISYKVSGLLTDEMISIYGDYNLNVNILKNAEKKLKGTIQVKELPVPFIDSLFSADASFEYDNNKDWELTCNYAKLEYLGTDITKTDEGLEFYAEGYAKPTEVFFHNVKAGIKNKQLEGTAAINLIPSSDKNISQYATNISLLDKNKTESFIFNSLFTLSDKIYFDGTCNIKNISLNRFIKKQRPENKIEAELIFLGNKDSLSVKADLKNISFNLNGKNLEGRAAAFIDNDKMNLYESSFKWGIHKIDNIEAFINPSEQKGALTFLYEAETKKQDSQESPDTKASFSFNFTSTADKKNTESQNIIENTIGLTSHFNIDMKISDWILAGQKGEGSIKASLVKEPSIIALYAGNNDEIYGFKADDGLVSLHIDESLPFHLNVDGTLSRDNINLSVSNIGIDLAKVINLIPNNNIIKFSGGNVQGDLQISGTQKDPLFYGTLKGEKLFCTSPAYSPDTYGPVEIPIQFDGTLISVPYTILQGKIGSLWAEASSEFIGWIPYYTTVNCGILENTQALIKTKNIAFHADGRAEGKIKLEINPELVTLEGDAYFDKGYFSVPFADLQKQSERTSAGSIQPAFYMNLNLNLGKKSEFRFPSTDLPVLRALAYTENEPFNLSLDTSTGKFEISGSAKIRTGEIFYIKRNFYIKEGELKILNSPFQQIEPIISVRAEIKDKMADGQPLTINLTAKDQHLDLERFRPVITTSPPMAMSDSDTMDLMGQVALGDLKNGNILKETLRNTSDILTNMGIMKKVEQEVRDFLHVDVFSLRSLLIQNVILENLFRSSKDKPLTIGNYFDNTSVYIGKYFGSAIYADAMLHLSYYDPLSAKTDVVRKSVYDNLLFQPEIGFEMNTPFFQLRWHIAPSNLDSLFVSDTGLTLSWKFFLLIKGIKMLKKKIIGFMLILFALNCFAQEPEGWYNGKPVLEIQFKGLQNIASSELDEIFKSYKKKPFSDELYWEILQKIYALDYFTDIVPKAIPADEKYQYVFLEFIVKEKPAVNNIVFTGNNNIRKADLLSAIKVKKGDIFNEVNIKNAERSLKDFYIEKGFTKAEISSKTSEDKEKNSVNVEFFIKEGKTSVITKILFEGNSKFPEKALKKVLVSKEAWLLQKGFFREDALQADKSAIKLLYGEHGYIDAHVETIKKDIDTESDPQKDQITLTYVIMEGEQFTYAGVDFEGNYIFSTKELSEKFKLKKGDVFNLRKFETGFGDVANLYFENGYTGNYIDKKENRNTSTKEVSYTIIIVERERSHIENIIIKGNTKTKDNVILREILLKEGDVFSKTKLINSFRNLANLRYFSAVLPDVLQGSEPDLVDIVINVEEQSTAGIQFGVTFSGSPDPDTFPMSVFAQWEEKNLFGTGRELSASINAASDTQSLILGLTENWFLGKPLSVGFNFSVSHKNLYTYQDILYPFNNVPDPHTSLEEFNKNPSLSDAFKMKYERLEFGLGMNSGYRWFPKFAIITLRGELNFGLVKNFYDSMLYRPYEEKTRNQQAKWSLSNYLKIKLSVDDRDLTYDPSKGWFLSQEVGFFGLFPKIEDEYFFQSDTKGEFYITLLDYPVSDIWNLKFVLGFYSGFSFQIPLAQQPISFDKKLYIDGAFKGRGWIGMGTQGSGTVMQNNWIEFRWPLAHGILSFDFFFDAIAVKQDLQDLKSLSINDYYFSFGPGLRFSIPQFPLRLMLANTFKSVNGKPVWGNGKGADWRFVLSFNIPNL